MPALVTFRDRAMADAVLPASIRSCLGLTDASSVYDARRPRAVKQPTEVVLLWLPPIDRGRGGAHQVTEHRIRAHVRVRAMGDAARSGKQQAEVVGTHLESLRAGFDGQRPWIDELEGDVLSTRCEIEEQDVEPGDMGAIEGRVLLSVFTKGTGNRDGAESPGG